MRGVVGEKVLRFKSAAFYTKLASTFSSLPLTGHASPIIPVLAVASRLHFEERRCVCSRASCITPVCLSYK